MMDGNETNTVDYDVALSYATEDRDYARSLAAILQQNNVKVFYDEYQKSTLWGKDLYVYLSELYQNRARYCVIIISKYYAEKLWTTHELKAAQARAFREREEYILPVRLDDTKLPGLLPTICYLSWPPESAETIAAILNSKLSTRAGNPALQIQPIEFEDECRLNQIQLQRAIHKILKAATSDGKLIVPLRYDQRVEKLLGELQNVYDNYEAYFPETSGEAALQNYSHIDRTLSTVTNDLETLPELVGAIITFFKENFRGDSEITVTCSRVVQLAMTDIMAAFASAQWCLAANEMLNQYSGLGSYAEMISKMDGIGPQECINYLVSLLNEKEARRVIAPIEWDGEKLSIFRTFHQKTVHFGRRPDTLPTSFVTNYAWPQMFWLSRHAREAWRLDWIFDDLDGKNLRGYYFDWWHQINVKPSQRDS